MKTVATHGLFALLMVLTLACGSPGALSGGSASESPVATTAPSNSLAPTPSPTPTLKPNPTAAPGMYTSLGYGYRVEMPSGWRRSACQSTKDPTEIPGIETFTNATVEAETGTDTGPANDVVIMRIEDNPGGGTALAWLESGKMGFSMATKFEQTTFDGNPDAARIVTTDGTAVAYVVNARFLIYAVSRGLREPTPASEASARALMTSLHILRTAELAEARATFAAPPAPPTRSAEEVADTLVRGFSQKDTSVLSTVASACLSSALERAGVGFSSSSKFLSNIQTAFTNGFVATIQARPIEFASGSSVTGATITGTWKDAGQPQRNVKLMMQKVGNTWFWIGVLYMQP